MVTNGRLAGSLFQVVLIAAGGAVLWGLEDSLLPKSSLGLDFLLWPVVLAAVLSLAVDLVFRLQSVSRLRAVLHLPEEFRPRVVLSLLMVRRSLRDASWLALLLGALVAFAGTRAEPRIYYTFIAGAGTVLVFMAAVRTASIPFPAVGTIFRFPWFRLLALGIILLLLQQGWAATYGFNSSLLLPALAAAMGASYLGSALRNINEVSVPWTNPETLRWMVAAECVALVAALATAASGAFIAWAVLGSLPNVSAAALDRWPDLQLGGWLPLYFGQLFEAKYLVAGLFLALGFARKLPSAEEGIAGAAYRPLLKAGAYGLAGYAAWLVAAKLAPLGHGYTLLGAAIAGGLFAAASALVVRGLVPNPGGALTNVARWLSQSTTRAFFLGMSLVLYGLLLRPLLYEALWFAPIYEWLVVLAFAFVPLSRVWKGVRAEIVPAAAPPAAWPNWSRHYQVSEERPDPRMVGLLALQQNFINTGDSGRVWCYLLGLLLRNGPPMESIPDVFAPMRRCYVESAAPRLWRRNEEATRERREAALADTMIRAEAVLSLPPAPMETVDEARLRETGAPFLNQGYGPERLAVTLTAAYWQQGADLDSAAALWFPLMTLVDDPASGSGIGAYLRWAIRRIFRRGALRWDRERRQRIIDGVVSHLFRGGAHEDLPMAVLRREVIVYENRRGGPEHRLPRGGAVEVLGETGTQLRLRPGEGLLSYFTSERLPREPVLPADHLVMAQEGIKA